ncbi:achaete-scute complex protein T3 [Drosophila serrata]|uniref:achaete-scute complex protein T3 n=1 Tax=Drosophila serrata TaxID=7274 RepID=UPI000A1D18D8|nr:achaete-scute complex protein T3 [Drosophila serrata]
MRAHRKEHILQIQIQIPQQQQHHQLIAPKMPLGNSQLQNILPSTQSQSQSQSQSQLGPMMKKKYNYNTMPYGEQLPSVARRNARERNRVKQVNNGFVNLRQHLPQSVINSLSSGGRGASKKLSKVDTLRIAVEYIRGLQDMLDDGTGTGPRRHIYNSADESSNDSYNDFDNGSLEDDSSPQQQFLVGQLNSYHSASPTPSYSGSDVSGSNCNSNSHSHSHSGSMGYVKQELPEHDLKFESFDSFSDEQPDDEELLDYISSWQEQ